MGKSCSRRDWQLEKPVAMGPPGVIFETGWLRWCLGVGYFARRVSL